MPRHLMRKTPSVMPHPFTDCARELLVGPFSGACVCVRRDVRRNQRRFFVEDVTASEHVRKRLGIVRIVERRVTIEALRDVIDEISAALYAWYVLRASDLFRDVSFPA